MKEHQKISDENIQRSAKIIKLSSVTHVPSGLMGCASAALRWWVGGRRQIQTCLNFFAPRCTLYFLVTFTTLKLSAISISGTETEEYT